MVRRAFASGQISNIPHAILNNETMRKTFNLPQRKSVSARLSTESFQCCFTSPRWLAPDNTQYVLQQAMTNAVTEEYLHAVIALFVSPSNIVALLMQPVEDRLNRTQLIGALLHSYTHLTANSAYRDVIYFEEVNATHMLAGTAFADMLTLKMVAPSGARVCVLNVHHDYIRIHHNLTDFSPLLHAMAALGKNEHE